MTKDFVPVKWKLKAMECVKENNALRKRIKEVIEGRDHFRKKYYDFNILYKEMEKRILEIDKEKKKRKEQNE